MVSEELPLVGIYKYQESILFLLYMAGTFESNVLSMITPLGKDTKLWAIIAIPVNPLHFLISRFLLIFCFYW